MCKTLVLLFIVIVCSGLAPAIAGACGGDTGLACEEGQFCELPVGICDPGAAEGECVDIPLDCPPGSYDQSVCGCDGVDYGNRCRAALAGVSLSRPAPCDGRCETVWGFSCLADEICVLDEDGCVLDAGGYCMPKPTECPEQCRLVCSCSGTTYRTLCDAQLARHPWPVYVARSGSCGESFGLHFASSSVLEWQPSPGATSYNLYLNDELFAAESNGPMCEVAGLLDTTWNLPAVPLLGEVWEIEVTPTYPAGEGPMGVGSLCQPRSPGQACDPH